MGRGRQKAKHTKVARDLKYFSPNTNYGALEKELGSSVPPAHSGEWPEYEEPEYEDIYGEAEDDDESDEVTADGVAAERKGA
jgi:hypothetical protein